RTAPGGAREPAGRVDAHEAAVLGNPGGAATGTPAEHHRNRSVDPIAAGHDIVDVESTIIPRARAPGGPAEHPGPRVGHQHDHRAADRGAVLVDDDPGDA